MATYDFTVRAQDETGAFSDRNFAIQVRNNLVDRILAIDSSDAYASVDGTTWTTRTGKGGKWCLNLLGKWIVCTGTQSYNHSSFSNCGTTYRLSEDTINWTENLKFWLSNDAPILDEQGNETQAAGPLYHQYFYPTRDQFSVINGKIIIPSIVNNKMMIVYSTDGLEWYAYESNNTSHESNTMGINADMLYMGGDNASWVKRRHGISNVVLHNGKYTMINNHDHKFYISDDLVDWEAVTISNESTLGNAKNDVYRDDFVYTQDVNSTSYKVRDTFWTIMSVNGVLWMMARHNYQYHYERASGHATPDQWYLNTYDYVFYTTNLTDISYPENYYFQNSDNRTDNTPSSSDILWHYEYNTTLSLGTRQMYYANGVIFSYCGRNIVTNKTLATVNRVEISESYNDDITGSCFFEGDIYYTRRGLGTGYEVRKLSIDAGEYTTPTDVTALPTSVIDITSV